MKVRCDVKFDPERVQNEVIRLLDERFYALMYHC